MKLKKIGIVFQFFIFFINYCQENFQCNNPLFAKNSGFDNKSQNLANKFLANTNISVLLKYFSEISKIPRCSGNKKKISDFIIKKAKENNLKFKQDNIGNIIVYKNSSTDLEKTPTVVLQAHLDMVCLKTPQNLHDFTKDSIKLDIKNNFIHAKDTTLGADNGIGMAALLAIMADKNLKHGPLELVFTVDEEAGSVGAKAMEKNFFQGKYLVNLDSFRSNEITIGSAGSVNISAQLPLDFVCRPKEDTTFKISTNGLIGGHSGEDIDKNRANAIKVLAYLIAKLNRYQVRLVSFESGHFANTIPPTAQAIINIPKKFAQKTVKTIKEFFKSIKDDLFENEPNMVLKIENHKNSSCMLSNKSHNLVLNILLALPHGTITKVPNIKYIPYTSTNLAVAKIVGQDLLIVMKPRSLSFSGLYAIVKSITAVLNLAGAKIYYQNYSPSWSPKKNSKLLSQAKITYKRLFGIEPETKFLHAVLEPANFVKFNSELDMISYGPNIIGAHSIAEKVDIQSIKKFWIFVINLLRDISIQP